MKNILIVLTFLLFGSALKAEEPFWELAMVPIAGMVNDIQVSQNNIIYIAGENGVFSSTNHGSSWNWIFDGNTNTISLDNDDIIVSQGYSIVLWWRNLYISFDRGKDWKELIGPWSNIYESYPTAHYFDNHVLYILNITYSDYKPSQSMYQIYFTNDYGKTWDSTDNFKTIGTWNFEYDLFKVKGKVIAIRAKNDTSSLGDLLYISRDFGKNWKLVKGQFSIINDIQINDSLNYIIATNTGLYYTNDGGENWNLFNLSRIVFNKLLISNDMKSIIAAYNKGLYFSTDSGKNWDKTKDTFDLTRYAFIRAIAKDSSSNYYVAPHYYGIYRASDLSSNWKQINNGFSSSGGSELAFNTKNDVFMTSLGIFHTTNDNWKNWTKLGYQTSLFGPVAINKNNDIFIGNLFTPNEVKRGVYRSTDNGKSWEIFNNGLGTNASINNLLINKRGILYRTHGSGGGSISRSKDNGETWEYLKNVYGTRISINDEDHIFVFDRGTIYRSTNDGDSWQPVSFFDLDQIFDDFSERIIFNNKTKTAFYSPVRFQTQGMDIGKIKTTDNGRTWFRDSSNYYNDVDILQIRAVDSLYCWIGVLNYPYSKMGIYRSCDNGLIWQRVDTTGFKHKRFGNISVSTDGHIYVFGETGGLYRSRDKFVSVEENPKPTYDITINPNPTSDFIEINVGANGRSSLQSDVRIYDVFGQIVSTPVCSADTPASGGYRIDVSGLAPGLYFVRIGDKVQKFVKL